MRRQLSLEQRNNGYRMEQGSPIFIEARCSTHGSFLADLP
jgi:hypothetical protein